MTQSSVEWLINEIDLQFPHIDIKWKENMISKAKTMHKQEIEKAWNERIVFGSPYKTAKDYYNGTFGKSEQ